APVANKITLIQIGEDHFFTLFVFDQHCHRAFNDVVQRFRFFTLVNKRALGWVLMNVAMRQEPFESRVCLRFAKHHARLSSVISFLQSQMTPLSLDCRNMLPATWEGAINCTAR